MPLSVGGGAATPSNTTWPGPRPTSVPSVILMIHPTVWPQYTSVTDRQTDRQTDNGHIAYRANRFTNGRPKTTEFGHNSVELTVFKHKDQRSLTNPRNALRHDELHDERAANK